MQNLEFFKHLNFTFDNNMSEQAQLFLLQRRLNEIKNYKRYALILGITFSIVLAPIWPFDFFIGLFLAMFVGTAIVWGVERHYRK